MPLNLEKQLLFYGAYHHNPVNVGIHMTFVPILLATGFLLATNTPTLFTLPDALQYKYLPPNLGTIGGFVYSFIYILLEPVAGALIAPGIIATTAFVNYLTMTYGMTATYWAAGIHVVSWLVQFVGHGVFEKRAPALLDNLIQAFLLAPLFVWMEILFSLGYRPELKSRLDTAVEKEIARFKQQNGSAKAANTK
ncbi:hypothetical protein DTO271G3_496 [Paecilomyces variotii]|nr:hypothetical protein DTO271G3_496 [Paecilomyces variotii]